MESNPWTFGWTQLLAICGLFVTVCIAVFGFRSFEKWRREKLEEKRIDIALEAMALAYESKYVFESIRSPMAFDHEASEMPRWQGESDDHYRARMPYYVALVRIEQNKDFFERLFKLQPKFMALFGEDTEEIFMKCHQARRKIEVSAGMLMRLVNQGGEFNENRRRQRDQWECDIWQGMDEVVTNIAGAKRVSTSIKEFQLDIVEKCKPISERSERHFLKRLFAWKS